MTESSEVLDGRPDPEPRPSPANRSDPRSGVDRSEPGDRSERHDRTEGQGWLANAGSLVAGRLVVAVLGWAGTIVVARSLDAEEFGRFTFVFGLLGMLTIITDLGLGRVALGGVMPGSDDPARYAGSYVVLRSLLGLIGYGVAVGFTAVAGYPSEIVTATAIGGAVVIIATASHAYEIVLQARLRLGVVAVAAIAGRVAQLGLIAAAVSVDGGLFLLLVPAIVAELVIAAVKIPRALRLQPVRYSIRPELWWQLLREAVPLSVGAALATLAFRVDAIMLSKLADFTAVAVYGVAFKFVDLLHFISLSVSAPLLTVLVAAWPSRPEDFRRAIAQVSGLLALLAGGLVVGFALFAAEAIELLYGARYLTADGSGALVLQLLLVGEIVALASMVALTALTAAGRHGPYPWIALAGLTVNVGLNLVAIPRWGIEGAAATTVVTEVVIVVGMGILMRRLPGLGSAGLGPLVRVAIATSVGVGVGLIVDGVLPWLAAAAVALVAYAGSALALGVVAAVRPGRRLDGGPALRAGVAEQPGDRSTASQGGGEGRPVVFIGHSRSGSGAELVAIRYADALLADGRPVQVICPDGFLAERMGRLGATVVSIPDLQLPSGPRALALSTMAIRWARAAWVIRRRTGRRERLVVNGLLALPAVALAGRSGTARWLVHDVVVRSDLRLVARLSTRRLAGAVAVSDAAAAFPLMLGLATTVVRNGTAWPVAPAEPATDARPVIGINAKVTPWKGHHVLLDAMAALPDADLEVLGSSFPKDAPYLAALEARAAEPDLAGRVRFLGHRDDPAAAMRSWSIAVSASIDPEAGPLAVLEAMSLGIPVVATNHGGAVEVLGSAGLLVEPGEVAPMADALGRLLADGDLRSRCSVAGRTAVEAGLTEQASNERFLALLDQPLGEPLDPPIGG